MAHSSALVLLRMDVRLGGCCCCCCCCCCWLGAGALSSSLLRRWWRWRRCRCCCCCCRTSPMRQALLLLPPLLVVVALLLAPATAAAAAVAAGAFLLAPSTLASFMSTCSRRVGHHRGWLLHHSAERAEGGPNGGRGEGEGGGEGWNHFSNPSAPDFPLFSPPPLQWSVRVGNNPFLVDEGIFLISCHPNVSCRLFVPPLSPPAKQELQERV